MCLTTLTRTLVLVLVSVLQVGGPAALADPPRPPVLSPMSQKSVSLLPLGRRRPLTTNERVVSYSGGEVAKWPSGEVAKQAKLRIILNISPCT